MMNESAFEEPNSPQPNISDIGRIIVSGYDPSHSLPLDVAESALEKHFSSCGEVTDVCIDVDDSFVIYLVGEGAVDKALQLNGSELDGWKLTVEPFPFPEDAKDKIVVRVEGLDTSLSKNDLQNAFCPLFSQYGKVEILLIHEGFAIAAIYGENIADKASELNGFYMGERKLAVRWVSVPRIRPVHALRHRKWPTLALLDAHHSAIPQSSESFNTPDKPAEKKRKKRKSSKKQQTPDREELFVDDIRMGDPNGKKAVPGKMVTAHLTGKLQENGMVFYSKRVKFRLGGGFVIEGVDIGVNGMRVGGERKLTIPPSMGFGEEGRYNTVPPYAWVVYDVKLINVK